MTNETEQLRRLVEARERATKGDWKDIPQSNGSSMIAVEFETGKQMNPKGLRLIANTLARKDSLHEDQSNTDFISLSGTIDLRSILTRMEKMEAALRFYADEETWSDISVYLAPGDSRPIDMSQRAKEALE